MGILSSVAYLLAATIYQENPDRNHMLWNMQVLLECYYIYINGKFTIGKLKITFKYSWLLIRGLTVYTYATENLKLDKPLCSQLAVRITWSLVFCVVFCRKLYIFICLKDMPLWLCVCGSGGGVMLIHMALLIIQICYYHVHWIGLATTTKNVITYSIF